MQGLLVSTGFSTDYPVAYQFAAVAVLLGLAWLFHLLLRRVIVAGINSFIRKSSASWDDAMKEAKVFDRFAVLVPIIVLWYGSFVVPDLNDNLRALLGLAPRD